MDCITIQTGREGDPGGVVGEGFPLGCFACLGGVFVRWILGGLGKVGEKWGEVLVNDW